MYQDYRLDSQKVSQKLMFKNGIDVYYFFIIWVVFLILNVISIKKFPDSSISVAFKLDMNIAVGEQLGAELLLHVT